MSAELRTLLADRLTPEGIAWLDTSLTRIAGEPQAVVALFPAAGRACGRRPLTEDVPAYLRWTVDDAVRVLLLEALPYAPERLVAEVTALYGNGDAAERRGVLRALAALDRSGPLGDAALPIIWDALRTNDSRLISAALGEYAAAHLDPEGYRQAVLKCVFNEIPLADVAGLSARADAELARMLLDYAQERAAAGRSVPADIWPIIDRFR